MKTTLFFSTAAPLFLGAVVACGTGQAAGRGAGAPGNERAASAPKSADQVSLAELEASRSAQGEGNAQTARAACAAAKPVAATAVPASPAAASTTLPERSEKSAPPPRPAEKAKESDYTIADLRALETKGEWRELMAHLDDVPPAKRDGVWDALLENAGPKLMAQTVKEKDPFEAFWLASHLVDRYPGLTRNRAFLAKRVEVSKTALTDCFAQSYRGDRCLRAAKEVVETGDSDPATAFAIAKIVRLGQNAHVAAPFFVRGLETRKGDDAACADPDLRLAVLSALALPTEYENAKAGRTLAGGVCFAQLKSAVVGQLTEKSSTYYRDNACSVLQAKSVLLEGSLLLPESNETNNMSIRTTHILAAGTLLLAGCASPPGGGAPKTADAPPDAVGAKPVVGPSAPAPSLPPSLPADGTTPPAASSPADPGSSGTGPAASSSTAATTARSPAAGKPDEMLPPGSLAEQAAWTKLNEELAEHAKRANTACGTAIRGSYDVPSYKGKLKGDQSYGVSAYARSSCESLFSAVSSLCASSEPGKARVKAKIKGVQCSAGSAGQKPAVSLGGSTLKGQFDPEAGGAAMGQATTDWLMKSL